MDINIPMIIIALACLLTIIIITKTVMKKNVKKHRTEIKFAKFFQLKTETEFEKEN